MNFEAAENALCLPGERMTRLQRCALRALLRTWPTVDRGWRSEHEARVALRRHCQPAMRDEVRQEYGSVLALWVLITAAGAALSWLCERVLSRLFPDKNSGRGGTDFAALLDEWAKGAI